MKRARTEPVGHRPGLAGRRGAAAERLLRLYPRAWRARYGEEFLALLRDGRLTSRSVFDVVSGAVDARLSSWRTTPGDRDATSHASQGGAAVLQTLKLACRNPSPVSTRDWLVGAGVMLGLTAIVTLIGVGLDKTGYIALGQFVIRFGFFVGLQVSLLFTFLKGQPVRVQAVLAGGPLAIVAGILGASIWLARAA